MNETPTQKPIVLVSFEVDREQWARFDALAKAEHRSRSAQLRKLIDQALEHAGTATA